MLENPAFGPINKTTVVYTEEYTFHAARKEVLDLFIQVFWGHPVAQPPLNSLLSGRDRLQPLWCGNDSFRLDSCHVFGVCPGQIAVLVLA